MIPAQAVEAAAKAWMDRKLKPGNWTQEDSMRAALEAAAPHIVAEHFREINRKAIAHEIESPLTYVKNEGKK